MMRKYDTFWESNDEWYYVKDGKFIIRDDAPQETKDSYYHYLEQCKEVSEHAPKRHIIA